MEQQTTRIGLRLKAARQRAGLTQQQLADGLGLKHRQIIGRMEDGQRTLSAPELIRAMELLGVDLDYFTDVFRLEGEGEFTFRTGLGVSDAVVDEFERRAGRWIAMHRELSREQGRKPRWLELKLALSPRSSYRDAQDAGEAFADRMQLGDCPADTLRSVMEDRLGILVLDVDAPPGVSGGACRVRGLNCVLVGRGESEERQNFDLAYELFHLLTWDAIPPRRAESSEVPRRGKGWRVERLAESFASALLMPWSVVRPHWRWGLPPAMVHPEGVGRSGDPDGVGHSGDPDNVGHSGDPDGVGHSGDPDNVGHSGEPEGVGRSGDPYDRLNDGAVEFRVSAVAYKWRLRSLGELSREDVDALDDRRLVGGRLRCARPEAPLFSREFVSCVATALEAGRLSARRAASLLDLSLPDLASLFNAYGHEAEFEA